MTNQATGPGGFVTLFVDFARDSLSPLTDDDGRVDGTRDQLLETAALIVLHARRHCFEVWPGDCTHGLVLLGEVAAILIAEQRCCTPTGGLRAILQAFKQELDVPISSRVANGTESLRQIHCSCSISFAAVELDNLAACSRPPTFGDSHE